MTVTARHAPHHPVCPFISDDVGDESLLAQMGVPVWSGRKWLRESQRLVSEVARPLASRR